VSFAAITLCIASQRVFIVVYFVIDSVRKLLDIPSYGLVELQVRGFLNSALDAVYFTLNFYFMGWLGEGVEWTQLV
jgi:hypothetical protein